MEWWKWLTDRLLTSLYILYWSIAQTVGTWGAGSSWERDIPWLQALAQMSRVLPTALSPTRTHLTSSDLGCSSSISLSSCKLFTVYSSQLYRLVNSPLTCQQEIFQDMKSFRAWLLFLNSDVSSFRFKERLTSAKIFEDKVHLSYHDFFLTLLDEQKCVFRLLSCERIVKIQSVVFSSLYNISLINKDNYVLNYHFEGVNLINRLAV